MTRFRNIKNKQKKIALIVAYPMRLKVALTPIINELNKRYEVVIITNTNYRSSDLKELMLSNRIIHVPIARKINILRDTASLRMLISVFKRERFFILHSVSPKSGLLVGIARIFSGTKLHIHTFTGQIWANKVGIKRLILKYADKIIASICSHILVDGPGQKKFLESEKVIPKGKGATVFLSGSIAGVNVNKFKPVITEKLLWREEFGIPANATVYLYLGRLRRDKGVAELVQAFVNMNTGEKSSLPFLAVVGDDEDGLSNEIQGILERKRGVIIPHVEHPEKIISISDVFCIPSYREGFSTVILQAAACGIPVIGTDIYGINDSVVSGKSGLLVDPGNISELKEAMEHMLYHEKMRREMGEFSRKYVETKFDEKLICSAWVRYYQELQEAHEQKSI